MDSGQWTLPTSGHIRLRMTKLVLLLVVLRLGLLTQGQRTEEEVDDRRQRQGHKISAERQEENVREQGFRDKVELLCVGRPATEYFRLTTKGSCKEVVRCDRAGIAGTIRLASVKCPSGLAFDLEKQTCDWKAKVDNCDTLSKARRVKPNFNTEEPVCPDGQLQCANDECLDIALFCDEQPDCSDGSDENACGVEEDPNRAAVCDPSQCSLPDCFCSADGTKAPGVGGQPPGTTQITDLPMMITITFNGAVNNENVQAYDRIFNEERLNPNDCTAKGTFFVSHKYTNYSAVQELHRKGHEIGVFSITNKDNPKYWTEGTYDTWLAEMAGSRLIIETFANISDQSVLGMRAPFLRVGGNKQFSMMFDNYFSYDASITAPLSIMPIWPYTFHYRMPHKCHGNSGNCPSRSHLIWELPINELDRRDDPTYDERLTGCHLVSSCSINQPEQFLQLLQHNFNRHYNTNRAPLSLSFDPSWLISNKGFTEVLANWMTYILTNNDDVYFISSTQVLQWMQTPTGTVELRDFQPWKDKCTVTGQPLCSLPKPCPLTTRELPGQTLRLHTCEECPSNYPWIVDPTGNGFAY